jgi:subtilisin family serine protease
MKKIACLAISALLLYSCNKQVNTPKEATKPNEELMSKEAINAIVKDEVIKTGQFNWASASEVMVWSALSQTDNILSVGFKPGNENADIKDRIHEIDINSGNWKAAKEEVLLLILAEERKQNPSLKAEDILIYKEEVLPLVNVKVSNLNTIKKLRSSNLIRYAEPMGYQPEDLINPPARSVLSSSGCGGNTAEPGLVNGSDYTVVAPNAIASWNYVYHNIQQAWNKTSGGGTKVMIIDSGVSSDQSLFGTNFNNGSSAGRTIEKIATLPSWGFLGFYGSIEAPADQCGHGTQMAGACAAPRNSLGGAVGVAYNCNLICVRASSDVFINESRETKGVSDAFVLAGNRSDVKIVSMSMGNIISSSQITDAIRYANNKGKLIFCAAGTSFGWSAGFVGVIFPAWLPEVNAVTGIQDNLNTRCVACHEGSEVDFVVVMEKASNTDRHPTSVAQTGFAPSTVGGSSVATATTAGMAALVWSKNPSFTKTQVLNKLISASSNYPTRSSKFGWGRINADAATN